MTSHIISLVSSRVRLWDKSVQDSRPAESPQRQRPHVPSRNAAGQTEANTQKESPLQLLNETFSRRVHTYARCYRPCKRCQMGDDGGIACLHVARVGFWLEGAKLTTCAAG